MPNPFTLGPQRVGGRTVHPIAASVDERLAMVRTFNLNQLAAARRVRGLQLAVRRAITKRERELARDAGGDRTAPQSIHPGAGVGVGFCPHPHGKRAFPSIPCGCNAPRCRVCGYPKHCALHTQCVPGVDNRPWDHEYVPAGGAE